MRTTCGRGKATKTQEGAYHNDAADDGFILLDSAPAGKQWHDLTYSEDFKELAAEARSIVPTVPVAPSRPS